MKAFCIAVLLLFASLPTSAAPARPTFAEPRFPPSKNCPQTFNATRAPGNQVISILRVAKSTRNKDFLEVGAGRLRRDQSACTVEIRLEQPLATAVVLSIDMRGEEVKDPSTSVTYTISLGRQDHKLVYGPGRWLDGSPGDAIKRFQVPMSAGTRLLRLKFTGSAVSADGQATAIVAIDSMDLCVIDLAKPEVCGAVGRPNASASAASAAP